MAREFSPEELGITPVREFSPQELGINLGGPQRERTTGEAVTDIGASVVSGIGSLVQFPSQLYGLVTGDFSNTGLMALGKGIEEKGEELKSEALKQKQAQLKSEIDRAEQKGLWEQFKTAAAGTIKDPALFSAFLAEQAPQFVGPALVGKGVKGAVAARELAQGKAEKEATEAATKAGMRTAIGTGVAMQGADVGAGAYESIYYELIGQGLTPDQAKDEAINLARGAGASGAVISLLTMRLPGATTIEKTFLGIPGTTGRIGGAFRGFAGESISEMLEESGGRLAQNIALAQVAPETDILKGVGTAAGLAAIGGGTFGGVAGGLRTPVGKVTPEKEVTDTELKSKTETLLLPGPQDIFVNERKHDPLTNPLGNFFVGELTKPVVDFINQDRIDNNKPKLKSFSLEDIVDALTYQNLPDETKQKYINSLLTYKTGYQFENDERGNLIVFTPQDIANAAGERNISAGEITTDPVTGGLTFGTEGMRNFLTRTTGTDNLSVMSQPQLYSAFKALKDMPGFAEATVLEPETNAVRYTEKQYNDALRGLERIYGELNTDSLGRTSVIDEIQQLTGLTRRGDAVALYNQAIQFGDLETELTVENVMGKPTNVVGVKFGGVQADLPQQFDIRKQAFKQRTEPEFYEIRNGNITINADKSIRTAEEAEAYLKKQEANYERLATDLESKGKDSVQALQRRIQAREDQLDLQRAQGLANTQVFQKLAAHINAKNKADEAKIRELQDKIAFYRQPLKVVGVGEKPIVEDRYVYYENDKPVAAFGTRAQAQEFGVSRTDDAGLQSLLDIAPDAKGASPKRLKIFAEQEKQRREGTLPKGIQIRSTGVYKPEVAQKAKELEAALAPIMKKLGLDNVRLKIVDSIANGTADGSYVEALIKIAYNAENPMGTIRHEAIHALKELGAFTDAEWKVLTNKAKSEWIDKYIKKPGLYKAYQDAYVKSYGDLKGFEEYIQEEAIAEAFRDFANTQPPAGLIGQIFERISALMESLRNVFSRAGFQTAGSIFERVEKGEVRTKAAPAKPAEERFAKKEGEKYGIPNRLWELFEKSERATAISSGRIPEGRIPRIAKREETMAARRFRNAVNEEFGEDQALNVMRRMAEIASIEEAVANQDTEALEIRKVSSPEAYAQVMGGGPQIRPQAERYQLALPKEKVNKFFNDADKIIMPEGVEIVRDNWIGGVAGIGDRDSAYELPYIIGGKEYTKQVQDLVRKDLGNSFKGYRLMAKEEFEEIQAGAMGTQLASFTLDPMIGLRFSSLPMYARRPKGDLVVVEMDLTPEHIQMIGHFPEKEVVVDYGQGYNSDDVVAYASPISPAPLSPQEKLQIRSEEIKKRTMADLEKAIPVEERVVSSDPTKLINGKKFSEGPLSQIGVGFLPYEENPEEAERLIQQMWEDSIQESGGEYVKNIVRSLEAMPPTAEFFNQAMKLPEGNRYWYELSGEKIDSLPLPEKLKGTFLDVISATSLLTKPLDNAKRAVSVMAEYMQKKPVETDLISRKPVMDALETSGLETLKFGNFAGTMKYVIGLIKKPPITTNDRQIAVAFNMSPEDFVKNQVMYEVVSRFYNKMRDAQNSMLPENTQPYESWQLQALTWVEQRGDNTSYDSKTSDDYDQALNAITSVLDSKGIPLIDGKISTITLLDSRVPKILSGTIEEFQNAFKGTIESNTLLTDTGEAANEIYEKITNINEPWSRNLQTKFIRAQRKVFEDLASKGIINDVISAVLGRRATVSRIDSTSRGTFEGKLSPNMRIPMTVKLSGNVQYTLNENEAKTVLAILGDPLNQAAMAASLFKPVNINGDTFRLFFPKRILTDAEASNLQGAIGYPLNLYEVPNGGVVEINIGGYNTKPNINDVRVAVEDVLGDVEVKAIPTSYDSIYITKDKTDWSQSYKEVINAFRNSKFRRGKETGLRRTFNANIEKAINGIREFTNQRNKDFREFTKEANEKYDKYRRGIVIRGTRELYKKRGLKAPPRPPKFSLRPSAEGRGVILGTRQPGASIFTGRHFGKEKVDVLLGSMYGTGIKGAEAKRLEQTADPRIKNRVYFYLPNEEGKYPTKEVGLGPNVYTQKFDNILGPGDLMSRLYNEANRDSNDFESMIVNQGFDGYALPDTGMMVILNHDVPVSFEGKEPDLRAEGRLQIRAPETPEFKQWFKGSKVVDENGKPLLMYHGTPLFEGYIFKPFKTKNRAGNIDGYYFTSRTDDANDYAGLKEGAEVIPAYLSIKNPYVPRQSPITKAMRDQYFKEMVAANDHMSDERARDYARSKMYYLEENGIPLANAIGSDGAAFQRIIKAGGYDGYQDGIGSRHWVAFEPNQVKSAFNVAPTESPDVRYQIRAPQAVATQATEGPIEVEETGRRDNLIFLLQDKQIDLKRIIEGIKAQGREVLDKWNAYLQEELFHGRSATRVKFFIDRELQPLLRQMDSANITLEQMDDYLLARHAREANDYIRSINKDPKANAGMTDAEADAYIAAIPPARRRVFERLATEVDKMTKETRQLMVDYGLESQETIDQWEKTYKKYVPLFREETEGSPISSGRGYSIRGSTTRQRVGSSKKVVDVLANIAMQRERTIARGEKNRVGNALFGLILQNPNRDFWMAINPDNITKGDLTNELIAMGLPPEVAQNLAQKPKEAKLNKDTGLYEYKTNPMWMQQPNVFVTRVNGQDRIMVFNQNDERAARMAVVFNSLDQNQKGQALSMMGTAGEYFQNTINAVGKATRYFAAINTQYNPAFSIYNFMRDIGGAVLNLQSTPLKGKEFEIISNAFIALKSVYQDLRLERAGQQANSKWGQIFEEFELEGGKTGYRDVFTASESRARALEQELESFKRGGVRKKAKVVFDWLSDFNDAIENAIRVATYQAAKDKGMSNAQAASFAKNITVNFNRTGAVSKYFTTLYAFFNASVQGSARIAQTLLNKDGSLTKTGKMIVGGGLGLGVLQAVLLAIAGFDEDEPPEFVKDKNLVIPYGDKKYIAIPMPLGYNVIPSFGRRVTEFVMSSDKNVGKAVFGMANMILDGFNPLGSATFAQTITPTITDPIVALAENKDFTSKPIAKDDISSLNPTPGYTRAKENASAIGMGLAYAVNLLSGGTDFKKGVISPTPDQIDYLIGQITGGVGREILKIEKTVTAGVKGEELATYNIPIVGRMVGDIKQKTVQTSRFYDNVKSMNEHQEEIEGLMKAGKDINEYFDKYPEATLYRYADRVYSKVADLKKKRKSAKEAGFTDEELKPYDDAILELMVIFNETVKDTKTR